MKTKTIVKQLVSSLHASYSVLTTLSLLCWAIVFGALLYLVALWVVVHPDVFVKLGLPIALLATSLIFGDEQ